MNIKVWEALAQATCAGFSWAHVSRSGFAGSQWCCSTESCTDLHLYPHLVLSDFLIFASRMGIKGQLITVWTYLSLMTNEVRQLLVFTGHVSLLWNALLVTFALLGSLSSTPTFALAILLAWNNFPLHCPVSVLPGSPPRLLLRLWASSASLAGKLGVTVPSFHLLEAVPHQRDCKPYGLAPTEFCFVLFFNLVPSFKIWKILYFKKSEKFYI